MEAFSSFRSNFAQCKNISVSTFFKFTSRLFRLFFFFSIKLSDNVPSCWHQISLFAKSLKKELSLGVLKICLFLIGIQIETSQAPWINNHRQCWKDFFSRITIICKLKTKIIFDCKSEKSCDRNRNAEIAVFLVEHVFCYIFEILVCASRRCSFETGNMTRFC